MKKLNASMIKIGQTLAWNVYESQGSLLLRKGIVVQSDFQLESLLERGMFVSDADWDSIEGNKRPPENTRVFNPFWLWDDIATRTTNLLRSAAGMDDLEERVTAISVLVTTLADTDPDASLACILLKDASRYAFCHPMHTAILAAVVSRRMGWSDQHRSDLIRAALSMNIAMIDLQTMLLNQQDPLSMDQRFEVNQHPRKACDLLKGKGITNPAWLEAVRLHHEKLVMTPDAGAHPDGKAMSQLIRILDIFSAKISSRGYRMALQPPVAAKGIFVQERDMCAAFVDVLIKEIGFYMPGTFVTLANAETAVVIKRGANINMPKVASLARADGMPYIDGPKRDTSNPQFAIKAVLPKEKINHILNLAKIWGY